LQRHYALAPARERTHKKLLVDKYSFEKMSHDFRKVCWYHSGIWIENLRQKFNQLNTTEEEKIIFTSLLSTINNKISLTSYTPELFLEEIKLVEKQLEDVQRRLGMLQ
jgi:hypothetical protein